MIKLLIYPCILLLFITCSNNDTKRSKSDYEIRRERSDELDSLNKIAGNKLSEVHNAIADWDSDNKYWFTYHLQEYADSASRPFSITGVIKDIIRRDSFYVIKVIESKYRPFKSVQAEISITVNEFSQFKRYIDESFMNKGCFIFKLSKVTSSVPRLSSDTDVDGTTEPSSYLTYDFNEILLKLEGSLQAYYIYKKLDANED